MADTLSLFRMYIEEEEAAERARALPRGISLSQLHIDNDVSDKERASEQVRQFARLAGVSIIEAMKAFPVLPFETISIKLVQSPAGSGNLSLDIEVVFP